MKKFITFISVFMLSLYSMAGLFGGGDKIYVTAPNGKVGQDAELTLNIKNVSEFRAWSCWVTLPEGIVFRSASEVTDRCSDDVYFYCQDVADMDNTWQISLYYRDNFSGNDGDVAKIKVSIPDDFEPGIYAVELQKCQLATADATTINLADTSFDWTIEGSGGGGSGTGNSIYMTGANGKVGQDAELTLNIKNVDEFCAWGGWVTLPEGIVFKGASVVSDRCSNSTYFDCQEEASIDNTWKISCLEHRKLFSGNDGAVAKISVSIPDNYKSGNYNVKLSHFSLSTLEGVSIPCDTTSTFVWKIEGEGPEPEPEPEQDTDISRLDNVIYLNKTEGFVGQEKTLSFQMKNTAAIRGFQFDLYLPEGVTAVKNSKGRILGSLSTGRLPEDDEHTLTIQEQADGAIRFLCASQYDETFTGNSGEIVTLTVNIAEDMADGDYPIVLKNMRLSETDISHYYDTDRIKSTLSVSSYTIGDINADGSVNVSDYIGIANHILGNTPAGFVEKAADVNEDNVINVSDYIGVANIILTGSPYGTSSNVKPASSRAKASDLSAEDNVIYVEPMNVEAGTQTTLSFQMKNTAAIRGFQFDLYLPQGVTAVKNAKGRIQGSLSTGRLPEDDEHTLTMQEQADGAVRFLCGSQYDETFTGTEGEILTLLVNIDASVTDGVYPIILKNMRLSETDISKFYDSDNVETTLTVGDPTPKVCAKPTIIYDNGKLIFECETEGAVCQSTITDDDIKSYSGNEVELCVTYNISVYATKDGYNDSEVTTATLCWIDAEPSIDGATGVMEMKAQPVLIQTQGSTITVQGAADGTDITVYGVGGTKEASAVAAGSIVTLNTSLRPGSVAVVKIGEKAVKVMIK